MEALPEMQEAFAESLQDLSALDRQVLVERHLISREHAAKGRRKRGRRESAANP